MKKDYETKRKEWLEKNGFSEDGFTYVIKGESYSIKDELKEHGFVFSPILLWHKATIDEKYAERQVKVALADVADIMAWGTGVFKETAAKYIKEITAEEDKILEESEFGEDIGNRIDKKEVVVIDIFGFFSRYGWTNVYKFKCDKIIYVWMTTSTQIINKNDIVLLSGTVKNHNIYKGEHQTILTRCKIKKWEH